MIFFVYTFVLSFLATGYQSEHCYARDKTPYLMFGTKTPYQFIHKPERPVQNIPGCQPIQFWLLSRHGTRYPKSRTFINLQHLPNLRDMIIYNHESLKKGRLCKDDLGNLKTWTLQATENRSSELTAQGHEDMRTMAIRFKNQFPSLLNQPYNKDLYKFRSTYSKQTIASAAAFAEGLFGSSSVVDFTQPLIHDNLIKAYNNCPKWEEEVEFNNLTFHEAQLFQNSNEMQALLRNVTARLGFNKTLSPQQVDDMYDMCRFDKAWKLNKISPWCAVFTNEELELKEYEEDLTRYYYSSYGNNLNVKLGCPPIKDFIDHFSKLENQFLQEESQPLGIFYFSHVTELLMVMSRLGVAKDLDPLTHDNYDKMRNRQWRTSKLGSFATNIAIVFYKCDGEKYRVMFNIAEHMIEYRNCSMGLCSWSDIKNHFADISSECDMRVCQSRAEKKVPVPCLITIAVVALLLFRRYVA